MLFIGIQAYILAVASPEKKTQGNAIIVFGFQGGMISGMAIGSLLVNYLHPQGVSCSRRDRVCHRVLQSPADPASRSRGLDHGRGARHSEWRAT